MRPELDIRESKPCNICGDQEYKVIYQWPRDYYNHKKFETASWDGRQSIDLQVVKCKSCNLVYTNPSFRSEYLDLIYPTDLIKSENRSKIELLQEKKWDDMIQSIKRYLPLNSSICDIGTRYGILVEKLKYEGYRSFGIELNKAAVEYATMINVENVFHSNILNLNEVTNRLKLKQVNAFILDDVLEHLVDPSKEIKMLSGFQKKDDILVLRQMNHDSFGRFVFRKRWYYYQPAAHMYFFDPESLNKLLNKLGYDIIEVEQTPLQRQIKPFLVQVLRYLGFKKYLMPLQNNGKKMYLDNRAKLEDMFLVVAKKK